MYNLFLVSKEEEKMSKTTEFEAFVKKSIADRLQQVDVMDLSYLEAHFGLMAEVGELMEMEQKTLRDGKIYSKKEYLGELGDILHYLTRIINDFNSTLDQVMDFNIEKIKKRNNL